MIASRLAALGIPPAAVKGFLVLTLALVGGLLAAGFPGSPFLPPVLAFLVGVGVLIDPNAAHA